MEFMKTLKYFLLVAAFVVSYNTAGYELKFINPPQGMLQNGDYMSFVIKSEQVMKVTFYVTDELSREKVIEITREYNPATQSSMEIFVGTFDACYGPDIRKVLFASLSNEGRKALCDRWILDTFPYEYKFVYLLPLNKIYVDNLCEEIVLGAFVKTSYERFRITPGKFAVSPQPQWILRMKTEGKTKASENTDNSSGPEFSLWGIFRKISISLGTQIQF